MQRLFNKVCRSVSRKICGDKTYLPSHVGHEFEVQMWNVSEFIIRKIVPLVGVHPFPLNELALMVAAVCRIRPTHIYEWGTNIGVSARIFYETVTYFGLHCEIHTIDLPDGVDHEEHPKGKRGSLVRNIKAIRMHEGDGVTTALDLLSKIGHVGSPLFFLDGDHGYESVYRELMAIQAVIELPNILIHDTLFQSPEANYNIGPYLAIRDFLQVHPHRFMRIDEHLGLPGMTLLYPNQKGFIQNDDDKEI